MALPPRRRQRGVCIRFLLGLGPVAFDVVSMLLRKEGVITHVLAREAAIQGRDRDKDGEKVQRFPHFF